MPAIIAMRRITATADSGDLPLDGPDGSDDLNSLLQESNEGLGDMSRAMTMGDMLNGLAQCMMQK